MTTVIFVHALRVIPYIQILHIKINLVSLMVYITTADMDGDTILWQQLLQDLLQVIGNPSDVYNFFCNCPCGHIDDIICHFGTKVKKGLLFKACANGHISVVCYLIGERSSNQDKYKYFVNTNGQKIKLQSNKEKIYFKNSTQFVTTPLHVNDTVYYLTDERTCDPQVRDEHQTPHFTLLACMVTLRLWNILSMSSYVNLRLLVSTN